MKKSILLLSLFTVFSVFSQNADINILRDINLNRNKQLDGVFRGITNSAAPVAIGTPVILYGISWLNKDSLNNQKAIYIGVTVISTTAFVTILKYAVNRPRPFVTYPDIEKVRVAEVRLSPRGILPMPLHWQLPSVWHIPNGMLSLLPLHGRELLDIPVWI